MSCHQRRNSRSLSHVPAPRLRLLQEADKTEETAFISSCAALQLLDRVLLTLQETRKNAKTATQSAYQPDDANCSHHHEK